MTNIGADADRTLLPDQLHADRGARRRRLFPRAVPPGQPAAVQGRSTRSSTASRARANTSAPTWPGASTTPAGGARARSSSSSTATANFPTICGTGTEDYFLRLLRFRCQAKEPIRSGFRGLLGVHHALRRPAAGDPTRRPLQVAAALRPVPLAHHRPRPLRTDLRVTIQALGWRSGGRYLPLQDDIASVAFWYQTEPHAPFPALPSKDDLEII